MKDVVFFSGPHGSGKTTLINSLLCLEHGNMLENNFDINFLTRFKTITKMNDFERCLLRLYHRMYVEKYAKQFSSNLDKVVLVSRSVYDSFAYIETYYQCGSGKFL